MSALSSTTRIRGRSAPVSPSRRRQVGRVRLDPVRRLGEEPLGHRADAADAPSRRGPTTCSGGRCAAPNGSRTVNVVPCPGALVAVTRAAVQRDQLGDQREADAGALVGAGPRAGDAVEPLEQVRHLVLGDAGAGVGDAQLGALAGRRRAAP